MPVPVRQGLYEIYLQKYNFFHEKDDETRFELHLFRIVITNYERESQLQNIYHRRAGYV